MAFNGILKDIAAAEEMLAKIDETFEESKKEREGQEQEWTDIVRRRAALGSNGDSDSDGDTTLARITDLIRRYGPMAAKRFGVPGALGAAGAAWLADDGAFASILAKIGLLF